MLVRLLLLALVLLLLAAGLSQASMISFEDHMTFTSVGTNNMQLQQFDPTLGTLNSVSMYVYASSWADFWVDNDYWEPTTAQAMMQHSFVVTAPGTSASGGDSWQDTQYLTADDPFEPSTDDHDWGVQTIAQYALPGNPHNIGAPFLGAYTGTGNVNIGIDSQVFQSNIIGLDAWWSDPAYSAYLERSVCCPGLDVVVRLEYNYSETDPVPEPTTLALLGIGMFGVGMRARRRKAAA